MPEPINYMAMMPKVDPIGNLMQGLQAGYTIQGLQQQQEDRDLLLKQKQAAEERQKQYAIDLELAHKSRSPEAWAMMTSKYPEQREAFKQSWDMLSTEDKKHEFSQGLQAHIALQNNNIPAAKKVIENNIQALESSGRDAGQWKQILESIDANPEAAYTISGIYLSSVDPEKWGKVVETYGKEKKQPFEIREAKAKAGTAESEQVIKAEEAKIAPQKVQADYNKTLAETNKLLQEPEFERQRIAIARQKNSIDRETNDIAKQTKQLALLKMQQDYMDKANEKSSKVYSAYDNLQNSKRTIDQALSYFKKGNIPGIGYAAERAHGPVASMIKTVDPDVSNYERLLETIGSQTFIKAVQDVGTMSGLTETEGQKLQSAMANLSLNQGPKQAKQNLILLKNLMEKSYKNVEKKYGINVKQEKSKSGEISVAQMQPQR